MKTKILNLAKNQSSFAKSVFALSSGTAVAQAVPIILSPLITRIYTPRDFADYALFISIFSLILVVVNGRYELAIVLPSNKREAYQISLISVIISAFISVLTLLGVAVIDNLYSQLPIILYLLPFAILLGGCIQPLNYLKSRQKNFSLLAKSEVSRSLSVGGGNIALGYSPTIGGYGLIISFFVGQVVQIYILIRSAYKDLKKSKFGCSFSDLKEVAKKYERFPKYSTLSAFLNIISSQIPIFFLSGFFAFSNVGLYFHAHKIMSLPLTFLGKAVGQVFFKEASDFKDDIAEVGQLAKKVVIKMFYISIFPLMFVGVYGDLLFSQIFGDQWLDAGIYAQIITPWIFLNFLASPVSFLFEIFQKQKIFTIFNFNLLIFRLAAFWIGYFYISSPVFVISCYSIVSAITYLFQIIYLFKLLKTNILKLLIGGIIISSLVLISLLTLRLWIF